MANLILLLAIILAGASFVLADASSTALDSSPWASTVCATVPQACENPHQLAVAAAALAGLWLVAKLLSALRE
jgi:hypothetical protein